MYIRNVKMTVHAGARHVLHGLLTTLGLNEKTLGPSSIPGKGRDFILSSACISALWPTKPPTQWAAGEKQSEREADNPSPWMAGVKMRVAILTLPSKLSQHRCQVSHTDICAFTYHSIICTEVVWSTPSQLQQGKSYTGRDSNLGPFRHEVTRPTISQWRYKSVSSAWRRGRSHCKCHSLQYFKIYLLLTTANLWILCGSQSKWPLFPCSTLTCWNAFTALYELSISMLIQLAASL